MNAKSPKPSPKTWTHLVREPRGYRSREAALFLAQFDTLSAVMWEDLAGASAAELAWQAGPGQNTIGMLLAHMALVEVIWIQRAGKGNDYDALPGVLGIGLMDAGMPLRKDGAPPAALRGWTLADFREVHRRARAFAKRAAKRLTDADLERVVVSKLRSGDRMRVNLRWILHHLLEHFAGHYGQALLLRHQYADRRRRRR